MGEVYRAIDTDLKREVAIKVLPESLAGDAERLARFQREAEVLAQLNHSNIAHIHGLERADGHIALVMELVDGPTLADRVAQGAIPVDEALRIAIQIAEALEVAHEQGIIHRDLKPANIKVRADGTVKVLDFGLAKAMEPAAGSSVGHSMSPTITTPAMTHAGIILGTAAYMSPEQARGKAVDKRADVWALGCVLYEMLAGQRAFDGEDIAETLGAVIHKEPNFAALPRDLPARVIQTVRLCLRKPLKERMPDMAAVRLSLDGAFDLVSPPSPKAHPSSRRMWAVSAAVAFMAAVLSGAITWTMTRPAAFLPLHATLVHPPPEVVGGNDFDANIAVSPDGRVVAYVATTTAGNGNSLPLYVHALDRATPVLLVSQARTPFFSPDGRWVGFVERNVRLSKVPVGGGAVVPIGGMANAPRGASWGDDGRIVFATNDPTSRGLWRIAADGGEPERLTTPAHSQGELGHMFPFVLPGSAAVLFTIAREGNAHDVAILDVETRKYRVLIRGGSDARYSASGHLVYGLSGSLLAVPFDLRTLDIDGTPVRVLEGVRISEIGAASFGLGDDGTLVYVTGGGQESSTAASFVWLDGMGHETAVDLEPHAYQSVAVSPQGDRIATTFGVPPDLWISTLAPVTMTRLTFNAEANYPVWSLDGRRILFGQRRNVASIAADGSGPAVRLLEAPAGGILYPISVDRQDRLLYDEQSSSPSRLLVDVKAVTLDGSGQPTAVLTNPGFNEEGARVSPDGRWVAFVSNESGRREVYVRTYPDVGAGKWQISRGGGTNPRWAPDSRGVYFSDTSGLMKATFGSGPEIGAPVPVPNSQRLRDYDVSRDGRLLLVRPATNPTASLPTPQLNIVLHWTQSLARLSSPQ
jgi:serine/threonine-protein kinase